ncbi:MAG: hypothetical protein BJ554DRAFT_6193, partial [Olpidium bornovanus]
AFRARDDTCVTAKRFAEWVRREKKDSVGPETILSEFDRGFKQLDKREQVHFFDKTEWLIRVLPASLRKEATRRLRNGKGAIYAHRSSGGTERRQSPSIVPAVAGAVAVPLPHGVVPMRGSVFARVTGSSHPSSSATAAVYSSQNAQSPLANSRHVLGPRDVFHPIFFTKARVASAMLLPLSMVTSTRLLFKGKPALKPAVAPSATAVAPGFDAEVCRFCGLTPGDTTAEGSTSFLDVLDSGDAWVFTPRFA